MTSSIFNASCSFPQSEMHREEQIQRVVSPANQASMIHSQNQHVEYESYYHRTVLDGNAQHDPLQQVRVIPAYDHSNI